MTRLIHRRTNFRIADHPPKTKPDIARSCTLKVVELISARFYLGTFDQYSDVLRFILIMEYSRNGRRDKRYMLHSVLILPHSAASTLGSFIAVSNLKKVA